MANRRGKGGNRGSRSKTHRGQDVMRGRSFAGAEYADVNGGPTHDLDREGRTLPDESDEFVTDAEIEAREQRSRGHSPTKRRR